MKKIILTLVLLSGWVIWTSSVISQRLIPVYQKSAPSAVIQTQDKKVPLYLDVADTPEKQNQGLMYRKKMDFDKGMIFPFKPERFASMWMKNTYIPLDMIFYDQNGIIQYIHFNARPHDETIIRTPMPVSGVIEVNAGFVHHHRISIGDKIIYPTDSQ